MKTTGSGLTVDEVKKIARLSRLTVSDSEAEILKSQLEKILGHVRSLSRVDTNGIESTTQTTGLTDVFREDKATPSLTISEALGSTDKIYNNYFVVPAVLDKDAQ